jgi:hypothetical protein
MRVKEKFSFGFNLIWVVQSLSQKYLHSLLTQITSLFFASRPNTRGVSRSSRTWGWDAMDATATQRKYFARTNGADADGEAVWS